MKSEEEQEKQAEVSQTSQPNQEAPTNESAEEDTNLEAWIWIIGGVMLATFSILTFIYVHPEAPPEGGGQFAEIVRVTIRVALFLCGCALARNGFKLLKK